MISTTSNLVSVIFLSDKFVTVLSELTRNVETRQFSDFSEIPLNIGCRYFLTETFKLEYTNVLEFLFVGIHLWQ